MRVWICGVICGAVTVYIVQCHSLLLGCVHVRFDDPTDPAGGDFWA